MKKREVEVFGLVDGGQFGLRARGTNWEKRRYSNLATFLADFQKQPEGSDKAVRNLKDTRFFEQIDVALFAAFELGMGYNYQPLKLAVEQLHDDLQHTWNYGGWKTLTEVARGLVDANPEMPIIAVFQGPIHNFLQDYELFSFKAVGRRAEAKLVIESNRTNFVQMKMTLKSDEPSGFWIGIQELVDFGWQHEINGSMQDVPPKKQTLTLNTAGDDFVQDGSFQAAPACEVMQKIATIWGNDSAQWALKSEQMSLFDKQYFEARSQAIIDAHEPDEVLDKFHFEYRRIDSGQ